jgi:regulator of sigma E protease
MEIVLLIVVLVVLILVHEVGHFIVAKWAGMRVDEFGIGYPPRALVLFTKGETAYTLNWLPFGGFVKIYGEDSDAASADGRSFIDKNRLLQALVLLAGIVMNLAFAWILISGSLALGTPRALDPSEVASAKDAALTVSDVLPGSPAETAGLQVGDTIVRVFKGTDTFAAFDPHQFTEFVAADTDSTPLTFDVKRNGEELVTSAIPKQGTIASDPSRAAVGVGLAVVGTVPVPLYKAPVLGAEYTWEIMKATAAGLLHFFASFLTLSADLSQVTGPVGIAGAVGSAAKTGFSALVSLTAIISINLALINIIPIPALDGGRLLFVLIEAVTRRRIHPRVAATVNTIGFALLILLMVVVTAHDIFKLVA